MLNVVIYPKCSTCQNALKWFKENEIPIKVRHIVDDKLSAQEIEKIHKSSGLPIKKFFNTSGIKYRELELRDKVPNMRDDACYNLLATDGMLLKRPLVYDQLGTVTVGFKVQEFEDVWKSHEKSSK